MNFFKGGGRGGGAARLEAAGRRARAKVRGPQTQLYWSKQSRPLGRNEGTAASLGHAGAGRLRFEWDASPALNRGDNVLLLPKGDRNPPSYSEQRPASPWCATAECYGLHCLFKSMLGGLCSFTKEGWLGSKASEAKAAKKVLQTRLSL